MKKQWRKAPDEEKEGINLLHAEITSRLSTLRRVENLRRLHKRKEHARSSFFKDPFKFVKSLFSKEKSGKLKTSRKDLEAHLKKYTTAWQRLEIGIMAGCTISMHHGLSPPMRSPPQRLKNWRGCSAHLPRNGWVFHAASAA